MDSGWGVADLYKVTDVHDDGVSAETNEGSNHFIMEDLDCRDMRESTQIRPARSGSRSNCRGSWFLLYGSESSDRSTRVDRLSPILIHEYADLSA